MQDDLLQLLKLTLPDQLGDALADRIAELERGEWDNVLNHPLAQQLLGRAIHEDGSQNTFDGSTGDWNDYIFGNAGKLLANRNNAEVQASESAAFRQHFFVLVAIAAIQAFIQSTVTGPPLPCELGALIFPQTVADNKEALAAVRTKLVQSLTVDGVSAFKLTPNVELLCLADVILTCPPIKKNVTIAPWLQLRKDFLHQRLLSEVTPTLQTAIYDSVDSTDALLEQHRHSDAHGEMLSSFVLERVTIDLHHGFDKNARESLDRVSQQRDFHYVLTGRLGKRTRYQERDLSQLVVLAKSGRLSSESRDMTSQSVGGVAKPDTIDLNDDTLLEAISFSSKPNATPDVVAEDNIPTSLTSLDPSDQPLLQPLDSIILLLLASSITNTSPADGLTREETLPYAIRVLDGGSSNWQIYSQALLIRSRIEGYKSRTTERGLLQLQALVDQVIAETTATGVAAPEIAINGATTFLPRAKDSESAPVQERLRYVYQLCSPTRWELEAELAARWVSLGGLRSALEIYERLEMWAEAALCWAATEREDKAKAVVRKLLFHASNSSREADQENEKWTGAPRSPPPPDAPRLYCILGDLDNDVAMWEKAWEVSNQRYARAQRTIGRHYFGANNFIKAAAAYSKALKVAQLHQPSWFALGCCLLELEKFEKAAEAFSRVIQLDDSDAEAWSNLAAALLRKDAMPKAEHATDDDILEKDPENSGRPVNPQQNRMDALQALKRAATLKHDNYRIWDNLLTVAASVTPPSYPDIINAQRRIIDIRGKVDGESCIDVPILENLVRHVIITSSENGDAEGSNELEHGLPRLVGELVDTKVVPLITTSARLWRVVSTLSLWRQLPSQALQAQEKSWRAVTAQPGWEFGTDAQWDEVVQATEDLVDAYESLGSKTSEETGEAVAKDWKFKARSAIRGIMGKGKESFHGTDAWERITTRINELKGNA